MGDSTSEYSGWGSGAQPLSLRPVAPSPDRVLPLVLISSPVGIATLLPGADCVPAEDDVEASLEGLFAELQDEARKMRGAMAPAESSPGSDRADEYDSGGELEGQGMAVRGTSGDASSPLPSRKDLQFGFEAKRQGGASDAMIPSSSEAKPYVLQGDESLSTPRTVQYRRTMIRHPKVTEALQLFWDALEKDNDGKLVRSEYVHLYCLISNALQMGYDVVPNEAELQHAAEQEWLRDILSVPGLPEGEKAVLQLDREAQARATMDRETLFGSLFEIADVWTDSISPAVYARFLLQLLHRVTEKAPDEDSDEVKRRSEAEAAAKADAEVGEGDRESKDGDSKGAKPGGNGGRDGQPDDDASKRKLKKRKKKMKKKRKGSPPLDAFAKYQRRRAGLDEDGNPLPPPTPPPPPPKEGTMQKKIMDFFEKTIGVDRDISYMRAVAVKSYGGGRSRAPPKKVREVGKVVPPIQPKERVILSSVLLDSEDLDKDAHKDVNIMDRFDVVVRRKKSLLNRPASNRLGSLLNEPVPEEGDGGSQRHLLATSSSRHSFGSLATAKTPDWARGHGSFDAKKGALRIRFPSFMKSGPVLDSIAAAAREYVDEQSEDGSRIGSRGGRDGIYPTMRLVPDENSVPPSRKSNGPVSIRRLVSLQSGEENVGPQPVDKRRGPAGVNNSGIWHGLVGLGTGEVAPSIPDVDTLQEIERALSSQDVASAKPVLPDKYTVFDGKGGKDSRPSRSPGGSPGDGKGRNDSYGDGDGDGGDNGGSRSTMGGTSLAAALRASERLQNPIPQGGVLIVKPHIAYASFDSEAREHVPPVGRDSEYSGYGSGWGNPTPYSTASAFSRQHRTPLDLQRSAARASAASNDPIEINSTLRYSRETTGASRASSRMSKSTWARQQLLESLQRAVNAPEAPTSVPLVHPSALAARSEAKSEATGQPDPAAMGPLQPFRSASPPYKRPESTLDTVSESVPVDGARNVVAQQRGEGVMETRDMVHEPRGGLGATSPLPVVDARYRKLSTRESVRSFKRQTRQTTRPLLHSSAVRKRLVSRLDETTSVEDAVPVPESRRLLTSSNRRELRSSPEPIVLSPSNKASRTSLREARPVNTPLQLPAILPSSVLKTRKQPRDGSPVVAPEPRLSSDGREQKERSGSPVYLSNRKNKRVDLPHNKINHLQLFSLHLVALNKLHRHRHGITDGNDEGLAPDKPLSAMAKSASEGQLPVIRKQRSPMSEGKNVPHSQGGAAEDRKALERGGRGTRSLERLPTTVKKVRSRKAYIPRGNIPHVRTRDAVVSSCDILRRSYKLSYQDIFPKLPKNTLFKPGPYG